MVFRECVALGAILAATTGSAQAVVENALSYQKRADACSIKKSSKKCKKSNCNFDNGASPKCQPLPAEERCPMYVVESPKDQGRCWETSFGACKVVTDGENMSCVPRAMPDTCTPCVGVPQSTCGVHSSENACKSEKTDGAKCMWKGFQNGKDCKSDWQPCDSITDRKTCNEENFGNCRFDDEALTCGANTEFPDCEPCRGGGKCAQTFVKQICKEFEANGDGCKWVGYDGGPYCTNEIKGYKCYVAGDPHIHAFEPALDNWDFMGIGEYMFVDAPTLKVHIRQQETRSHLITSVTGMSWFGPDFVCEQGTKTCSNTCGKTFELHIGHRVGKDADSTRLGPSDFEPTLIVHHSATEYDVYDTEAKIIDAFVNGNLCEGMTAESLTGGDSDDKLNLVLADGSKINLGFWSHPLWGATFYLFLVDNGAYDYFQPTTGEYENGFCNLQCNPVSCEDSMFTWFPNTAHAEDEDWTLRYAGLNTPYETKKGTGCAEMPTTQCETRPNLMDECPSPFKEEAVAFCFEVCKERKLRRMCAYDACATGDIQSAKDYTEICQTIVVPVPAPVASPTYEPTPGPTPPQCGAVMSDLCTQNSMNCGGEGAYFVNENKSLQPLFEVRMKEDLQAHNACTCEQICMIKGGHYWSFISDPPAFKLGKTFTIFNYDKKFKSKETCGKYRPGSYWTCRCWDETYAKEVILDPENKKVKKNIKRSTKPKFGSIWGGVAGGIAFSLD